jgi:hypothetical protein
MEGVAGVTAIEERVTGAAVIFIESDLSLVCERVSVARTVKVAVPAAEGEPEITPVELFKLSPAGRDPEMIDQV